MSHRLLSGFQREASASAALLALLVAVLIAAPSFYSPENLRDLILSNLPVLIAATGMTLVLLTGEIDISIGSQFAICSVAAGLLAKVGISILLVVILVGALGALLGAINGWFIARLGIPSIVVTLATMVSLRSGLRWATGGQWVQGLPHEFQWFGFSQQTGQLLIFLICVLVFLLMSLFLRQVSAGRAIYAVGSDAEAARLAGISPQSVTMSVFALTGLFVGLAAIVNSVRFTDIQSNAGQGLEMKTIAAIVVGGTSINGGRGSLMGTLIGVLLLGTIGNALLFLGINPYWEKAIQGIIILAAISSDVFFSRIGQLTTGERADP